MVKKPTVLIANGLMDAGGTESLLMEVFRHSTGRVRYVLLSHYQGEIKKGCYDDEIRQLGVEIIHIPSIGTIGIRNYITEFCKVVKEVGGADILHSHLNGNGGLISLAAKKAGIPVRICHCHADIHFTGSVANRIKEELSLTLLKGFIELYATDFWACSKAAWKRLFMPWRRKVVIDNMINPRIYQSSAERRAEARKALGVDSQLVIGSVGRVMPIKNYEKIISILPEIENAVFVCYGRFSPESGYCRSLLNLAESLGLSDRVRFMGNTTQVAESIQAFDIFVMPSFTEGFGMAALEAQAASLPTLVSDGVPEDIDMNLGLTRFLPLADSSAWIDAIRNIQAKGEFEIIDKDMIIEAFASHSKDSVSGARKIEDRYLELCDSETRI